MSNFTNPHGGPWGLKDPFLHTELNAIVEQLLMAPNFDQGSAHAPTGDVALSGSMGGGFLFDDLFPFRGELLVDDGLVLDASGVGAGFLSITQNVPFDLHGPVTFYGTSSLTWQSGTSSVWLSGTTITMASGSTTNLSGAVNVRGTMTFKSTANGGPGILNFETTSQLNFGANAEALISSNDWTWNSISKQTYVAGAEVAGVFTRTGRTTWSGSNARDQHRPAIDLPNANADVTIEADTYAVPLTITANRTYTLRHTAPYAPGAGERIRVYRTGTSTPSAFTAKFEREDGTIVFSFYNSTQGFAEFEFKGGAWVLVAGWQGAGPATGYYDDVW